MIQLSPKEQAILDDIIKLDELIIRALRDTNTAIMLKPGVGE